MRRDEFLRRISIRGEGYEDLSKLVTAINKYVPRQEAKSLSINGMSLEEASRLLSAVSSLPSGTIHGRKHFSVGNLHSDCDIDVDINGDREWKEVYCRPPRGSENIRRLKRYDDSSSKRKKSMFDILGVEFDYGGFHYRFEKEWDYCPF